MRRRFIKNMATVIAVSVAVSTCGVTAFADVLENSAVVADNGDVDKPDSVKVENVSGSVTAVQAYSSEEEGTASVSVTEDVSAKAESNAIGVEARSERHSTTTVNVGDNVTASAQSATGVQAGSINSSTTTVNVGGVVSVSADSGRGATGISANSNSGGSTSVTSNDVSATSEASTSMGIFANSKEGGSTSVSVSNVSATSETGDANGIIADSTGDKSCTNVTASSDVKAEGSNATGIKLGSHYPDPTGSGKTTVTVGGNVNATASSENIKPQAVGIIGNIGEGDVTINVGGDVTAKSTLKESSTSSSVENQKAYASGILIDGVQGTLNINVGGNVIQDGEQGYGIAVTDSKNGTILGDTKPDPVITVTVANDVTAEDTAIAITKNNSKSKMDITVDGTVSGGEHAIVIGDDTNTDNLNITVWKVETSDNQAIVETLNPIAPEEAAETAKAVEKNINYIIRVQSDVAISAGTTKIGDYDTAHQDDTVTLAVAIPSGYEIENFYNVSPGNVISLTKGSSEGTYLLVVPRGGGVDVGVSLKKVNTVNTVNTVSTVNTVNTANSVTPSSYVSSEKDRDNDSSDSSSWSDGVQNAGPSYYSWSTQDTSAIAAQVANLQTIHAANFTGSENVANVADVLTPVDTLTAINNFTASGAGNPGTENVMGAGVVSFNNVFTTSVSDTVDVPVVASVSSGMTYTVMFSDGTSLTVPCFMDGVLTIPFNKNAEGLTYIIYGLQIDPTMMFADPTKQFQDALAGLTP